MGNGTRSINSGQVEGLYKRIIRNEPQYRHYTIQKKYMVGVVGSPYPEILIYDLERSIKPLMRVLDQGTKTVVRDYYGLDDGINILQHLDRIVAQQAGKGKEAQGDVNVTVLAEKRGRLDQAAAALGVTLCPEGRVVLNGYQPTYGAGNSEPPRGR